jgi:uncharacterized protein YjiK
MGTKAIKKDTTDFPYRVNEPTQTMSLGTELKEISGLSLSANGEQLMTVNDEKGILFFLNKSTAAIEQQIIFHEDGDYESLEVVDNTIYICKSKGVIYAIKDLKNPVTSQERYDTGLGKDADIEGMAYDKAQNQLILTCKGLTSDPMKRAIYGFDLATKKCTAQPLFDISLTQVQDFLKKTNADQNAFDKYLEVAPSEFHFGPSGIAVHPQTGEWYVVSSVGKILLVISRKGEILNMIKLDKKIHPQPEGITFDKDGTLYISNEGKKEAIPNIHRFEYNKH